MAAVAAKLASVDQALAPQIFFCGDNKVPGLHTSRHFFRSLPAQDWNVGQKRFEGLPLNCDLVLRMATGINPMIKVKKSQKCLITPAQE